MRIFPLITFTLTIALTSGFVPPGAASAEDRAVSSHVQRMFRQLDADQNGRLSHQELTGEYARLYTRLLRTADKDHDHELSLEEFDRGLQPHRPVKQMTKKQPSRLPGSDELLLLLAMMDANADGIIRLGEVPERLRPFYLRLEQRLGKTEDRQILLRQVAQAAPFFTQLAVATVERLGLNVELEIALLPDKNWALVERLDRQRQPGDVLADPEQAGNLFRLLDANGDGQLQYEEVPEQFAARFDRLLARADRNRDQRISYGEFQRLSRRVRAAKAAGPMSDGPAGDDEMTVP
jgi:Ca2+-binding EF-hand superfamily protein